MAAFLRLPAFAAVAEPSEYGTAFGRRKADGRSGILVSGIRQEAVAGTMEFEILQVGHGYERSVRFESPKDDRTGEARPRLFPMRGRG